MNYPFFVNIVVLIYDRLIESLRAYLNVASNEETSRMWKNGRK